jgi:hypothetical protein
MTSSALLKDISGDVGPYAYNNCRMAAWIFMKFGITLCHWRPIQIRTSIFVQLVIPMWRMCKVLRWGRLWRHCTQLSAHAWWRQGPWRRYLQITLKSVCIECGVKNLWNLCILERGHLSNLLVYAVVADDTWISSCCLFIHLL